MLVASPQADVGRRLDQVGAPDVLAVLRSVYAKLMMPPLRNSSSWIRIVARPEPITSVAAPPADLPICTKEKSTAVPCVIEQRSAGETALPSAWALDVTRIVPLDGGVMPTDRTTTSAVVSDTDWLPPSQNAATLSTSGATLASRAVSRASRALSLASVGQPTTATSTSLVGPAAPNASKVIPIFPSSAPPIGARNVSNVVTLVFSAAFSVPSAVRRASTAGSVGPAPVAPAIM